MKADRKRNGIEAIERHAVGLPEVVKVFPLPERQTDRRRRRDKCPTAEEFI
jgi:hypothetical protein